MDVSVPVLGVPGRWVFGWTDARIGAAPVSARLTPVTLARIESQVAASWPPGPYALGSAAASVVQTVVHGWLRQPTVFTPVEHALDIRRAIVAVPVSLDSNGVKAVQWPALSARERVLLDGALAVMSAGCEGDGCRIERKGPNTRRQTRIHCEWSGRARSQWSPAPDVRIALVT